MIWSEVKSKLRDIPVDLKENRIKIPNAIIDSLGIKEGDPITIILDTEKDYIVIKQVNKKASKWQE